MAKIQMVRIDYRLIHGQVITKWLKMYPADYVVVMDNMLGNDEFMSDIYKMVPTSAKATEIWSVAVGIEKLKALGDNEKVFLLFKDVKTCYEAVQAGLIFDTLVVGGVPGDGTRSFISDGIYLSPEEIGRLVEISKNDVRVIVQSIPEEASTSIEKLIKK